MNHRLHIYVLIDALGWKSVEGKDFLNDILPHRQPLETVLGYSSGAIPTILTGKTPAEHGHWNLFYYDPEGSPFRWLRHFRFLPPAIMDNRVSRKLVKEMGKRFLGLGPLFEPCVRPSLLPWFNWLEKENVYLPGGIHGGGSIFDHFTKNEIPYRVYTFHQWTDSQILEKARDDIETSKASFFFLYLCELDAFLHENCGDDDVLEQQLHTYASGLTQVFASAKKRDPKAHLAVFSDHGMTPVRHPYDLAQKVESLAFKMPTDYLAVYDSTMARYWFFDETAKDQITQCLETESCGQVLSDEELQQLGVLFPDKRYGELVFLLDPGWIVSNGDFNGGGWTPKGMHGYHPADPYSNGVFLSDREPEQSIRTIADLYGHIQGAIR